MKRILLIALAFTVSTLSMEAQEASNNNWLITMNTPLASQGTTVLPGTIGFVSINDDDDETTNIFTIGTAISYRIINNLYGGLNITYGRQSSDDVTSSVYLLGPQIRYYIPVGTTSVFIGANYAFGKDKFESDLFDDETDISSIGGVVGLAYPLSSMVDFEGQLTYDATSFDNDGNESDATIFGFRIGFAIRL